MGNLLKVKKSSGVCIKIFEGVIYEVGGMDFLCN
jgi:hypothetical protein